MIDHIAKIDESRRVVYGWASVITEKGQPVTDLQGDQIEPGELHSAVDAFMADVRTAKLSHTSRQVGEVIHSMVFTKDISAACGIDTGGREGWLVGMYITDDAVWKSIKDGTSGLGAFSIGATAIREEI